MFLADEEITITLGDERIHLRPSLRAATLIERQHGGFPAVLRALDECSVTVIADLIQECATAPTNVPALLLTPGLAWRVRPLVPAFEVLVLNLMGADLDAMEKGEDDHDADARTTFAEVHTKLFRLATGWLGWTPAETWAASPRKIKQAYEGRVQLLHAVFGGGEEKPNDRDRAATADERFASGIRAMGTTKVARPT